MWSYRSLRSLFPPGQSKACKSALVKKECSLPFTSKVSKDEALSNLKKEVI